MGETETATATATATTATTDNASSSSDAPPVQSDKIVVHWLENSRAQRVLWLLEELGTKYEIKSYKRINMLAPPELKEVHPLGKSPVVTITPPSGETVTLAESGYIFESLISRYDKSKKLVPPTPKMFERYKYLLHYTEGSLMPPLGIEMILIGIKNANVPFFIKPITNAIVNRVHENYLNRTHKGNLDFLESMLKESKWFCGEELSGADVLLSFPLDSASGRVNGFTKDNYPKIYQWLERIKEREAHKRATEKVGGPKFARSLNNGTVGKEDTDGTKSMI